MSFIKLAAIPEVIFVEYIKNRPDLMRTSLFNDDIIASYVPDMEIVIKQTPEKNLSRVQKGLNKIVKFLNNRKAFQPVKNKILLHPKPGKKLLNFLTEKYVPKNKNLTSSQKIHYAKIFDPSRLNDKALFGLDVGIILHELSEKKYLKNLAKNYRIASHDNIRVLLDEYNYATSLPEQYKPAKDIMLNMRNVTNEYDTIDKIFPEFKNIRNQNLKLTKTQKKIIANNYNLYKDIEAIHLGYNPFKLSATQKLFYPLITPILHPIKTLTLKYKKDKILNDFNRAKDLINKNVLSKEQFLKDYMKQQSFGNKFNTMIKKIKSLI